MQRKVPSAITNITLNRATFTDVSIDGLTFVNFFYGNNGAGKSSIAHAIEEDDGIVWAGGKTAADFDVLVYNQDFIKIKASNFIQKKGEEHISPNLVAKPVMKLPTAEHFGLTEDKEQRLSEIIDEINSRTGKSYDNDVVVKAMLQIRDILMKSERLKTSAKNNTQKDFEFSYFDDIDDALIEGLSQNQDFFSLLLSNEEMKRQVLGIFSEEIYKSLRDA